MQATAERLGVMHLLDKRFAGVAKGVGSGKILGAYPSGAYPHVCSKNKASLLVSRHCRDHAIGSHVD